MRTAPELLWCLCGWSEKLETGAIKVAEGGLWRNESAHTAAAQPEVMQGHAAEMLEAGDIAAGVITPIH